MKIDKQDKREHILFGLLPKGECFWDKGRILSMKASYEGNPCSVALESGNIYFHSDDEDVLPVRNVRVVIDV